jgi:hypothetical protein
MGLDNDSRPKRQPSTNPLDLPQEEMQSLRKAILVFAVIEAVMIAVGVVLYCVFK